MMRAAFVLLGALLAAPVARGTGFSDLGQDIEAASATTVKLDGDLRLRGELFYNLDLDRGPTPSGEALFPVPLADPTGQTLTQADLRLRTDLSLLMPRAAMALRTRLDVLDNLVLGSTPDAAPTLTTSQHPPGSALRLKRAYAEILLPFGVLAAGRMGATWGLGMLANGGDCADCNSGDAADRVAFVLPTLGHLFALAYDFSAIGPSTARRAPNTSIDLDPSDDLRTVTFAVLNITSDASRRRRLRAGKTTFEYGAYASYRFQKNDVPAGYLDVARPVEITSEAVMRRGFSALALDAWLRLSLPRLRLEAEGALLLGRIEQASVLPGALLHDAVEARQFGAVIESDFEAVRGRFFFGLDAGVASGDSAPGFGAFPVAGARAPQAGDLDGAQANPPRDNRVDNFRFHPDYRIDRILFAEIVGAVTDAWYLRPHLRWTLLRLGRSELSLGVAAVFSSALEATSTPGGERPLGVEIDPTLAWINPDGFSLVLEHALLVPLAGLDNPALALRARPAQLLRLRLLVRFAT
ncbi:MAG: TIGR04551 family protein [Myxococcales bacterium]|nr:TIGR04551 family protein [Myxococcales bacterium]